MRDKKVKGYGIRLLAMFLIIVLGVMTMLTGCGKEQVEELDPVEITLESYVKEHPSEQEALNQLTADDPNAKIEFEKNTMRIIYTVSDEAMAEVGDDLKDILDDAFSTMDDTFSSIAKDLESNTGVDGIGIEVVYVDTKGEEISKALFN